MLDNEPENDEIRIEKMQLLASFAAPLYLLGFPEGSLEILQRGEALALEISRPKALAAVYHNFSLYHTYKGDISTAISYAEKCFNEAEKSGETELMLQNANSLCYAYFTKGDSLKTADVSRRTLKLFDEYNIDKSLSWGRINVYEALCVMLGGSLAILGKLDEAKIYLDKVIHSSNESASIIQRITCYYFLSQISWFSGDGPGMIPHALEMIKLCEAGDVRGYHGLALSTAGVGYFIQGEYKKAGEYGEKGLAVQKESGININTAWCYWFLSTILIDAPDAVHRAEECATEALNYAKGIGAKQLEAASYIMIGAIIGKAEPSRMDEALQSIQLGISMFENMKLLPSVAMGYLYLGELQAEYGMSEEARGSLLKAESLFREVGQNPRSYWILRIQGVLERIP